MATDQHILDNRARRLVDYLQQHLPAIQIFRIVSAYFVRDWKGPSGESRVRSLVPCHASTTVANPGGSIRPCQVFIGADTDYELTFGMDHAVGANQQHRMDFWGILR